MRRLAMLGIAALAAMAFVTVTAGGAATTLKFLAKETSSRDTAQGFTFKDDLFQNGVKVGTDRGVCKLVIPAGSSQPSGANCKVTVFLANGKIFTSAKISFNANHGPLTVTGGTGDYANATGTRTNRDKPND